ncbi:MAG: L,D-transpeptidase [candidate division WOR-3 bacterium]|nr:MAG: L,D-transpeptidase [candidate division WOR-3 bacterium]
MDQNRIIKIYRISTSKFGSGNKANSYMTPLGLHMIVSKIGWNARINTIFKNRRNTGKRARINSGGKDFITTRILRLKGLEQGKNRGRGIDTFKRCIYIHGTPHERKIGSPASHGCVRMTNADIIDLFKRVPRGTLVNIVEK